MLWLSNFLWQKDEQRPHHFSTPFLCHVPWYLCASLLPPATPLGHRSYRVRGGGTGTEEKQLCGGREEVSGQRWRLLSASLASLQHRVRTVGLALEHQEVCPPGKSASSVLIYRLNFLGSPVGHGNCDLCGGGPGISIPHHLLK